MNAVNGAWQAMKAQAQRDPLLLAALVANAEADPVLLSPASQAPLAALATRVAAVWVMYERAPSRAGVPRDHARLLGEEFWQLVAAARADLYLQAINHGGEK